MDIENKIQSLLFKISSEISKTHSSKRLFCLYEDGCQLAVFARFMNLNVSIPPLIDEYFKYWFKDILSDRFKRYYFNEVDRSLITTGDMDDKIAMVGEELFSMYYPNYVKGRSLRFTVEEALKLAEDFFDYYDKDMHRHFKRMLESGCIQFIGSKNVEECDYADITGITCSAFSQKSSFVLVGGKKDITFVATIIHEVIHSYIDSLNYDMTCEQKLRETFNGLYEVITYFSSSAFRKYLEEIHFDKNTITFLESEMCNTLVEVLGTFSNLEAVDFDDYISLMASSYGNLLSFHYFEKYLEDSEKTKDNILNFTLAAKNYDKDYLLNNYGLYMDEIENTKILEKRLGKNFCY